MFSKLALIFLFFIGSCVRLDRTLNNNLIFPLTAPGTFRAFLDSTTFLESSGDGNWKRVDYTGAVDFTGVISTGRDLYAYSGQYTNSIWKSSDSGRTWSALNVSLGNGPQAGAVCGKNIVIGYQSAASGLPTAAYSADGGLNWNTATLGGTAGAFSDLDCTSSTFYAVINASPLLFRSLNGGASWTGANPGGTTFTQGLSVLPGNQDTVLYTYGSTQQAYFVSTNSGLSYGGGGNLNADYQVVTGHSLSAGNGRFVFGLFDRVKNNCVISTFLPPAGTWMDASAVSCPSTNLRSAAAGNGVYLAGGDAGVAAAFPVIVRSPDGVSARIDSISAVYSSSGSVRDLIFVP